MRTRTIKWKMNVQGHTAHVSLTPWEYYRDADHMGYDEDGDVTHVEIRRMFDLSFTKDGKHETGCRYDHDLWFLTTSRPLTIDESWHVRETGNLPDDVTYWIVSCGGNDYDGGRTVKTLRAEIKDFCVSLIEWPFDYDIIEYN